MENKELIDILKNRLISLNKRSAIFYNSFYNKAQSMDFLKLYNLGIFFNLNNKPISLEKALKDGNFIIDFRFLDSEKFYKRKEYINFDYILKKAKQEKEEKNSHSLHLGFFFLEGIFNEEKNEVFRAPLIFKEVYSDKISFGVYKITISEEYKINNSLLNYFNKGNDKQLSYLELSNEDFVNFNAFNLLLKDIFKPLTFKIKNVENFINTFDNCFQLAPEVMKTEAIMEFKARINEDYNFYAFPMNLIAIGNYNISSSTLLSAYQKFDNLEFLDDVVSKVENKLKIKNDNFYESKIKTISPLDISQKKAIVNALNESTLIFGPPGTGKSQTIVNLIANIIYQQKSGLLITEKKVASDVVHEKLGKLNPFTLTIHNGQQRDTIIDKIRVLHEMIADRISKYKHSYLIEKTKSINTEIDSINNVLNNLNQFILDSNIATYINVKKAIYEEQILEDLNFSPDLNLNINQVSPIINSLISSDLILKFYLENLHKYSLLDVEFWNFYLKNQPENQEIFIFNILRGKNFNKNIGFFDKFKFKKRNENKDFIALKKCINKFIESFSKKDVLSLIEILKNFKKHNLDNNNNFDVNKINRKNLLLFFKYSFEAQNTKTLDVLNLEWDKRLKFLYNQKYKNDLNLIIDRHLDWVIEQIQIRKVDTTETYKAKSLLTMFNRMGKDLSGSKRPTVKKMFKHYYELLHLIFPIIIGSPESIADTKLLPLNESEFDYAIFDEASQIFIEKCLPAIYKSKNIIVSGDDKQLPPSHFFKEVINKSNNLDEDEEYYDEKNWEFVEDGMLSYDLDEMSKIKSLLDFSAGRFDSYMLNFHYRSKYAELINFSNQKYYNGQLKVISNPRKALLPVETIDVNGVWEDQTNLIEANKVIGLVKKIIASYKDKSIGIITFNAKQQDLIQTKLEELADKNSDIHKHLNKEQEYLFVKNIENVQGDERDIIIFSIGYAKNPEGKFINNFGPINISGGEKRLNVAISRSKEKMYVVKSIDSSIIIPRTKGAIDLKNFLKYAEMLQSPIKHQNELKILLNENAINEIDDEIISSELIDDVYNELDKKIDSDKFLVEKSKNIDGYLIDIVIFDKKNNKYLLAIACDDFSKDRIVDKNQNTYMVQSFLESRGWNFERVSALGWWKDKKHRQKILAFPSATFLYV